MRGGCGFVAGRVTLVCVAAAAVGLGPITHSTAPLDPSRITTGEVQLTATEALIMTGTDMHTVDPVWMRMAIDEFIRPTLGGDYTAVPVETPEEFWPFGGFQDALIDDSISEGSRLLDIAFTEATARSAETGASTLVFGYSQSAVIATQLKRRLSESADQGTPPVTFVLIGNPARPNGGIYARFFGEQLPGWTMSGATPTDTAFHTVDIARQYDFFADFPQDPSNVLAVANAVMGAVYAHNYAPVTLDADDPRFNPETVVETYGDTTYYFIPAEHLPLLQPLWDLGVSPEELRMIEPALRERIEEGYDRTIPFGQPTTVLSGTTDSLAAVRAATEPVVAAGSAAVKTPAIQIFSATATPAREKPSKSPSSSRAKAVRESRSVRR